MSSFIAVFHIVHLHGEVYVFHIVHFHGEVHFDLRKRANYLQYEVCIL
jgi:hypothetical protein